MIKRNLILLGLFFTLNYTFSQNCDCKTNFDWVKKTFEENDAGFHYALKSKGEQAYANHNRLILEKVNTISKISECTPVLYEWLQFFRTGHISIKLNQNSDNNPKIENQFADWETYNILTDDFKKYLDKKKDVDYEGIWETEPYVIGIKKEGDNYLGFIIESGAETWTKGQIKLKFSVKKDEIKSVFYMRDHSAVESDKVTLFGNNHLQIGYFNLSRVYPKFEDDPKYNQYFKVLNSELPYIEQINETTLFLRIPSFNHQFKRNIDDVLNENREKILKAKNLIIDIRNNGGGSDAAYSSIIQYLYTNPIRTVGVEFLSTKLNNSRMLEFINNPEYGFDDNGKKWAKNAYDKLESKLGEFVNLNQYMSSVYKKDTIYPYPQNVGIIINEGNGSTSEQFLLEAKQSKKVKLFGVSTYGVLDISNMHFAESPCKEFELGYSLSRSMRLPEFIIDERGIQPDYFLDEDIPKYEWINYVNEILNE